MTRQAPCGPPDALKTTLRAATRLVTAAEEALV